MENTAGDYFSLTMVANNIMYIENPLLHFYLENILYWQMSRLAVKFKLFCLFVGRVNHRKMNVLVLFLLKLRYQSLKKMT